MPSTARDGRPSIPSWEGISNFGGETVHAADFGDARKYAGKSGLGGSEHQTQSCLRRQQARPTAKTTFFVVIGPATFKGPSAPTGSMRKSSILKVRRRSNDVSMAKSSRYLGVQTRNADGDDRPSSTFKDTLTRRASQVAAFNARSPAKERYPTASA
jgi:hypothetical protein